MNISISLAQICVQFGSPKRNLAQLRRIIKSIPDKTDVLLLPELWSSSYLLEDSERICNENIAVLNNMKDLARRNRLVIGGSMLHMGEENEIYNTFHLIGTDGEILAQYNKVHLFRLMNEHKWMKPGGKLITYDFPWGKVGLAICYDLRFPELFRAYALLGCKAVFLVAEWPLQRIDHWKILLQARAIENQYYIAAVNNVSESGDETFGGNSMVIDPWGRILIEGSRTSPGLLSVEISSHKTAEIRKKIPVFEDRRFDIYGPPS